MKTDTKLTILTHRVKADLKVDAENLECMTRDWKSTNLFCAHMAHPMKLKLSFILEKNVEANPVGD